MINGVAVLGGARLVIDAAAVMSGADALAVADAALRRRICTHQALNDLLSKKSGNPGTARTATVISRAGIPECSQISIRLTELVWIGHITESSPDIFADRPVS